MFSNMYLKPLLLWCTLLATSWAACQTQTVVKLWTFIQNRSQTYHKSKRLLCFFKCDLPFIIHSLRPRSEKSHICFKLVQFAYLLFVIILCTISIKCHTVTFLWSKLWMEQAAGHSLYSTEEGFVRGWITFTGWQ